MPVQAIAFDFASSRSIFSKLFFRRLNCFSHTNKVNINLCYLKIRPSRDVEINSPRKYMPALELTQH
jgi:hypothetical protein